MQENPGYLAVANNVVKQLHQSNIVDMQKAVESGGYKTLQVTKTPNFQRILFSVMPYELIAEVQRRQMSAYYLKRICWGTEAKPQRILATIKENPEWVLLRMWEENKRLYTLLKLPNWDAIDKALDKLYKLGGFYAAEKVEHTVQRPLEDMSEEEIDKMISQHVKNDTVKLDKNIPNVITGQVQAETIDIEPSK